MPLLIGLLLGAEEPVGGCLEVRDFTATVCLIRDDDDGSPFLAGGIRSHFDPPASVGMLHRLQPPVSR